MRFSQTWSLLLAVLLFCAGCGVFGDAESGSAVTLGEQLSDGNDVTDPPSENPGEPDDLFQPKHEETFTGEFSQANLGINGTVFLRDLNANDIVLAIGSRSSIELFNEVGTMLGSIAASNGDCNFPTVTNNFLGLVPSISLAASDIDADGVDELIVSPIKAPPSGEGSDGQICVFDRFGNFRDVLRGNEVDEDFNLVGFLGGRVTSIGDALDIAGSVTGGDDLVVQKGSTFFLLANDVDEGLTVVARVNASGGIVSDYAFVADHLIVGKQSQNSEAGADTGALQAIKLFGNGTTADEVIDIFGVDASDNLGRAVVGPCRLTSSEFKDVVVGRQPGSSTEGEGGVTIFTLSESGLIPGVEILSADRSFGEANTTSCLDLDGDGRDELIVGLPDSSEAKIYSASGEELKTFAPEGISSFGTTVGALHPSDNLPPYLAISAPNDGFLFKPETGKVFLSIY